MDKRKELSDISLIHEFHKTVCNSETKKCPYWNNGCSYLTACRKYSSFKSRKLAEKRKEEENRLALEKIKKLQSSISKEKVTEMTKPGIEVLKKIESLQRSNSINIKQLIFDVIEARKLLEDLIK